MQTVRKGKFEQLQFKGDPMRRPVMSREVGFLVRGLVKLSEWLNTQLKLDQPVQEGETAETLTQVLHCAFTWPGGDLFQAKCGCKLVGARCNTGR